MVGEVQGQQWDVGVGLSVGTNGRGGNGGGDPRGGVRVAAAAQGRQGSLRAWRQAPTAGGVGHGAAAAAVNGAARRPGAGVTAGGCSSSSCCNTVTSHGWLGSRGVVVVAMGRVVVVVVVLSVSPLRPRCVQAQHVGHSQLGVGLHGGGRRAQSNKQRRVRRCWHL